MHECILLLIEYKVEDNIFGKLSHSLKSIYLFMNLCEATCILAYIYIYVFVWLCAIVYKQINK